MLNNKTFQISILAILLLVVVSIIMYINSNKELVEKQRDIYKAAACMNKENLKAVVEKLPQPELFKDKPEQWQQAKQYIIDSCDEE